jgi:peptidoglycan/xylan/chitin deacetylase (PgdA/CDA1 family)
MSLPPGYLEYPRRRHGMDHDRYAWSMLSGREPAPWPDGRPLAVWINLCVEHFTLAPTGGGFKAHGAMTMPYPDLRHYTLRDYGNRVGVYRVLDVLAACGLHASVAPNAAVLERYPALASELRATGYEWIAHGLSMDDLHHEGLGADAERALVARSLECVRAAAPGPVHGWLSPARAQSTRTPELLREAGIGWSADWVNDELPYRVGTANGPLVALPLSLELEDRFVIGENLHAESEWADQVVDAFDFLLAEAQRERAPRLLALNLHAWVVGQPHRIRHLERICAHVRAHAGLVWNVAPSRLVEHCHPHLT